jgi:glucose uptake protein GlcU
MSFLLVPIFIVVAYMFDLHLYTSTNYIVLIAAIVALAFFAIGLTFILLRRERTERTLKPSYYREFIILLSFSTFGVVGFGIFYTYLGGSFRYVPHVLIPLSIVTFALDIVVGNKFFNVDIIRN